MAKMPRGMSRTAPDEAGDLYDAEMARQRASRVVADASRQRWAGSPARMEAQDATAAGPGDPAALRYFPVIGSAIDAYEHFRDGKPLTGAMDAGLAAVDAGLAATGAGVVAAIERRTAWNTGKMTGNAIASQLRRRGVVKAGEEVHHTAELRGTPRNVESWKNHPAFIKILPKADHRRLHGKWGDLPKYNGLQAYWVGTPTWMKTVPAGAVAHTVQGIVDLLHPPTPLYPGPSRPAPYGERPLR